MFELHHQLAADTVPIRELELSSLRLMNVAAIPWLILVPRREGASEIFDLEEADQVQLMHEIAWTSRLARSEFSAHKINVAALGNMVAQLHVHVIVRYKHDAAWPKPVWGNVPQDGYGSARLNELVDRLRGRATGYT